MFALHGAGQSKETFLGLFSWLAKHKLLLVAPDLRGHGQTNTSTENGSLALDELAGDAFFFISSVLQQVAAERKSKPSLQWAILGHSIGGCVAVAATELFQHTPYPLDLSKSLPGAFHAGLPASVVLLDCATECVSASVERLDTYLDTIRPQEFATLQAAVAWHIERGIYRSSAVASASLLPCLIEAGAPAGQLAWRTDLTKNKGDWKTWAKSVSQSFVSLPKEVKKLLVMSNHSLLDAPLLTAEMQGSIAVKIIQAGHQLHENASDKVAMCIISLWQKVGVLQRHAPVLLDSLPVTSQLVAE
mgnify:CR=1 FL=1